MEVINVYRVGDAYGCFSNFAPYPIMLVGQRWPTGEDYFPAQGVHDPVYREVIRPATGPMTAARMGRDRQQPRCTDWKAIKDALMYDYSFGSGYRLR
ncbi:MAG: hypothetical protein ACLFVO_10800 [Chloroflexaceae bacterium]